MYSDVVYSFGCYSQTVNDIDLNVSNHLPFKSFNLLPSERRSHAKNKRHETDARSHARTHSGLRKLNCHRHTISLLVAFETRFYTKSPFSQSLNATEVWQSDTFLLRFWRISCRMKFKACDLIGIGALYASWKNTFLMCLYVSSDKWTTFFPTPSFRNRKQILLNWQTSSWVYQSLSILYFVVGNLFTSYTVFNSSGTFKSKKKTEVAEKSPIKFAVDFLCNLKSH